MAPRTDTRAQMVRTAAKLFQRQGYGATGWRQVVAESETPWGSQSHHFPGGKEELAVAALERSGRGHGRLIESAFADADPDAAVAMWADAAAAQLEATGWAEGCPVATLTLEMAHESPAIANAADDAFVAWRHAMARALVGHGLTESRAGEVATVVLAAIEGAMLMTRARRDTEPLRVVGAEMSAYVAAVLAATRSTP